MNVLQVFIKIQSLIIPLVWLLLFGSSQPTKGSEIIPRLRIENREIDICSGERSFLLVVEIDRVINRSDSLILCEILIGYNKKNIILDNYFTAGTLFEQLTDWRYKNLIYVEDESYNLLKLECGNLNRATYSSSLIPLVVVSGRFMSDKLEYGDVFIANTFFNDEFKIEYYGGRCSDDTIWGIAKNLYEREFNLIDGLDSVRISELADTVKIQYHTDIYLDKNIKAYSAEVVLSDTENVEINRYKINCFSGDYYLKYAGKDKIILDVIDYVPQDVSLIDMELIRKNEEASRTNIIGRVYDVNVGACSMNNRIDTTEIVCPLIVSMEDVCESSLKIEYIGKDRIRVINDKMIELVEIYDLLGRKIDVEFERLGVSETEVRLLDAKRGIYYMLISHSKGYDLQKMIIN